jgi:DNA repair protein RecO (recombination protein O)
MPDTTTAAFVLRAVDLRESDRLLTLLTRDLGKVSAVARGVRASRKRFGGALEPFALVEVVLGRGRGREGLFSLSEASLIEAHAGLASDLERLGAAALVIELAREVIPDHEPDARLFDVVAEALGLLSRASGIATRALAISAALRVLACAGLALSASRCNACGRPVPPGRKAHFDPRRGGIVCTPCGAGPILLTADAVGALAVLESETLAESAVAPIPAPVLLEIEAALGSFLEQHLSRPLRADQFRRQVGSVGG